MATFSDAGLQAESAAEWLVLIRDAYEAELAARGLPTDVVYDLDSVAGILTAVQAQMMGRLDEALQAVVDSRDPNNASGLALDNIGLLRQIPRRRASFSTATVDLTGDAGTVVPAGRLVEGGGPEGKARWATVESVTLPASVEVRATEAGAITATVGEIDKIVTPVDGWTGVTNPAAVTPSDTAGNEREESGAYRARLARTRTTRGSRSLLALQANLEQLAFVDSARVIENATGAAVTLPDGVTVLPANSVLAAVSPSSLSSAQEDQVAEVLFLWGPAGIEFAGTAVSKTITTDDGVLADVTVSWDYLADVAVDVAVTVTRFADGYALADVEEGIEDAVAALYTGGSAYLLAHYDAVASVPGVLGATITLNGTASDVLVDENERAVLNAITVS